MVECVLKSSVRGRALEMVLGLGTRVDALDLALDHGTSSGLLASVMLELEMELDLLVECVIICEMINGRIV